MKENIKITNKAIRKIIKNALRGENPTTINNVGTYYNLSKIFRNYRSSVLNLKQFCLKH